MRTDVRGFVARGVLGVGQYLLLGFGDVRRKIRCVHLDWRLFYGGLKLALPEIACTATLINCWPTLATITNTLDLATQLKIRRQELRKLLPRLSPRRLLHLHYLLILLIDFHLGN